MAAQDSKLWVSNLAASHGDQLRRFLIAHVRNPTDIPDITQEVYLRLLRIARTDAIRSPEAYLFTVARHVAQQHSLRQFAAPTSEKLAEMLEPPAVPQDPALDAAAQQLAEQVQVTLDRLTPRARAVFILHRREGMTADEIAERMGLSRPMVKKYLLKALMRLRTHLGATE